MAQSSSTLVKIAPTLATPPSTSGPQTYALFVGMANGHPDGYLFGVEGDLPLVVDELAARSTKTVSVITDLTVQVTGDGARALPPTLQCVKNTIEEVGQALGPGDILYVYVGGHIEVENEETSFMPLPNEERLYGNVLGSWLKAAAGRGGTITAVVDVCHSTAFLKMPVVYDVKTDGSLYHPNSEAREAQGREGHVIIISSTECGQLARSVGIDQGKYVGSHGFFTWLFFNYIQKKSGPVDTAGLLLYLRKQCNWHEQKPRPQISATTAGLRQLPIGRPSS
ncbi:hypothetical protein M407DRAFT_24998 [Tulasnella calospora MUT 4182]|uniref:Uncharacterized protein n=1 Tax=Tulasnella calospora MUT 4182 TaxID=1051891 RepID=A0A0C3Q7L5_9AGAM|nr:hypothetical protein M407DRAFT_24998 [Tulasnella calospora MUT 4182]